MHSEELDTAEATLRARFSALKAQRGGEPIYALEHGLSVAALQRLRLTAGSMLRLNGIDPWWTSRSLPLIVLATEAGYHYQGTGTDFWPVLASRLGATFTDRDRRSLTGLFEAAHRTLGIKRPAPSAWNLAFRHIAWPIANAVAPIEIHRALALALHRMFGRPPSAFEGADLAAALRRSALADGAPNRLLQWLQDDQLAAAMSRRLLNLPEEGFLDAEVVHRIWTDMSSDIVTRRALGSALAEHRQLQTGGRGFGRYSRAHFALQFTDGAPVLHVVPPLLGPADHDRLARQVQGRRVRLWNVAHAIDLQNLCEGRSTPLVLNRLPETGEIFLSDDAVVGLDGPTVTALRGLEPDLEKPLLFPSSPGASAQTDVVRPGSARHWWWVARRQTRTAQGVILIGRIGEADVLGIDIDEPAARSWLEAQGIPVERGPILEPVLAPVLDRQPRGHTFPAGLSALFQVMGSADGTMAVLARTEIDLSADQPFVVVDNDPPGDHDLRLRSPWPETVGGWRRLQTTSPGAALISVAPDVGELTLEALLSGELSIRLTAAPGLATPALNLSVIVGGAEIARARTETVGPMLFGGGSLLLRELTGQLKTSERFERGELVAELEGISRETWPLGRRMRMARWERLKDSWTPLLDGEPVQVVGTPAGSPGRQPVDLAGSTGPALLLPMLDDGRILDGNGLVVGPRSLNFGMSVADENLDDLGRRWEGPGDGGLCATSKAWIRWSCADTAHIIFDLVRSRAIQALERMTVRQLCGRGWLALEDELIGSSSGFWAALASLTMKRGMATGNGFPALAAEHRDSLRDCLAVRFEATAPYLRRLPPSEIEVLAPELDEAVNEAWEDHFQALERAGVGFDLEDECDAGNDGSAWAAAVRDAEDRHQLGPLGRKLAPQRRGRALMTFSYESASLSALGTLLETEHVDLRTRPPHWLAEGDIRRGLMFWADPRAFSQESDGSETLQKLLADRQTARAIRYASLRYALSRGRLGVVR
jgi:hypothetical protein